MALAPGNPPVCLAGESHTDPRSSRLVSQKRHLSKEKITDVEVEGIVSGVRDVTLVVLLQLMHWRVSHAKIEDLCASAVAQQNLNMLRCSLVPFSTLNKSSNLSVFWDDCTQVSSEWFKVAILDPTLMARHREAQGRQGKRHTHTQYVIICVC